MQPIVLAPVEQEGERELPRTDADFADPGCPICAGALHASLRKVKCSSSGESFGILRCEVCGLGKTWPAPSDLAPYYADYHGGRHGPTVERCDKRRISVVSESTRAQKPGSLLDIGCGDGSFLLAAQNSGWQVQGTEFNPQSARQKGLVVVTDISEIPTSAQFDCITLWHSLEHLSDPVNTLRSLRSRLSPTGVLLISVPDIDGLQAKFFGRRWFHLDVPRHLFHYNRKSLSALLQATGFCSVRRWHLEFEYDVMGWAQSALNSLLPTPNVFVHLLMGRSPRCSTAEKVVSYIAGVLFAALALPLVAMGALFSRGATLVVAAQPCDSNPA